MPTRPEAAPIRPEAVRRDVDEDFGRLALQAAFDDAAAAAGGVVERHYEIAGLAVLLRFAGPSLVRLAEAFSHLHAPAAGASAAPPAAGVAPRSPELRVHLWDLASTGISAPQPPFEGRVGEAAGLRVLWQGDRLRVVLQPAQRTLNAIDESRGAAWFWCADPAQLPFWEISTPLRMVLHWWMAARGVLLLHAAAVGYSGGGALIVGKGGSGKSTTSLLSLRHGLEFAGDDYVAVDPGAGSAGEPGHAPQVHSVFGTGKLTAGQYANFPELHPVTINADKLDTEKAVVFVGRLNGSRLVRGFPLRAILVPRISGRAQTTSRPISALAALTSLAPSTIFQLPGSAAAGLSAMSRLAERVPAFGLDLGTDLDGVPTAIAAVLRALGVRPE